jgi:hypothetical protein
MLKYLNGTRDDVLTLSIDDMRMIKWFVDASFAVHPDFQSHTGGCMMMGRGSIISTSRKQKINTKSSTTAELVGVDDMSTMMLWTKLFLEEQGYTIEQNILYQDNKSAMLLEKNGKRSSSQRTRAMNIRYFFITDQIEKGNMQVKYCPTDEMVADFFTKPVCGPKYYRFKALIMGQEDLPNISLFVDEFNNEVGDWHSVLTHKFRRQECVGTQGQSPQGHSYRLLRRLLH